MNGQCKWVCSDPDCSQYRKKLTADSYEFYQIVPYGCDDGSNDFAIVHDIVVIHEQLARTSAFIEKYFKSYGYSGVDEIEMIYGEDWLGIAAECIFETESCFNSANYIQYGTDEFCEGYIAAKIER